MHTSLNLKAVAQWSRNILCFFSTTSLENEQERKRDTLEREWGMENDCPLTFCVPIRCSCTMQCLSSIHSFGAAVSDRGWQDITDTHAHINIRVCEFTFPYFYAYEYFWVCMCFCAWICVYEYLELCVCTCVCVWDYFQKSIDNTVTVEEDGWAAETGQ